MQRILRLSVVLRIVMTLAATLTMALLFVVLFEPGLAYKTQGPVPASDTRDFLNVLGSALEQAPLQPGQSTVFAQGAQFYNAELAQIRSARSVIDLEAFIFHDTPVGRRFLAALTERAKAGIRVRVVVDAVGSLPTPDHFFDGLRAAGGQVAWYQPFRWYTLKRWNNRTHRELLIIDGHTAFVGGAGIGSAWDTGDAPLPPWRDVMVQVDGATARGLQSVFAQSWLESHGEILIDSEIASNVPVADLPLVQLARLPVDTPVAMTVGSTPTGGRSTRARVLFQLMVGAARKDLLIASPYFVPDLSMRQALLAAAARGVRVRIITNGVHNNHPIARLASRRHYGELIAGGIAIHEYQPGMTHTKVMLVDGLWSVIGSTNFDNRSFGLNNEVNLAQRDVTLAHQLELVIGSYLGQSHTVSLEDWSRRSLAERVLASIGIALERQE
ncbi:phospholipase D-like domain-containing protein [Actimicrobium antarcticum]|uniref:Phospholipase D-like domain-containing protein n=1 Tax=Actimicrobium antarcticum TaxID=1051899 RepID=A0ABP7SFQ8_9BURK